MNHERLPSDRNPEIFEDFQRILSICKRFSDILKDFQKFLEILK